MKYSFPVPGLYFTDLCLLSARWNDCGWWLSLNLHHCCFTEQGSGPLCEPPATGNTLPSIPHLKKSAFGSHFSYVFFNVQIQIKMSLFGKLFEK